jgi:outer membrane biosynthesis protein TonB
VAVTLVLGVLLLAACGSESRVQVTPAPRLPRTVASSLATRSDALASALRRRDACAARIQVHGLERQIRLAIRAGRVPVAYRARLLTAATRLAARVPRCVPPPPPASPPPPAPPQAPAKHKPKPKPPKDHKKPHHKHHGKGGGG